MIISTTESVAGYKTIKHLGIVSERVVVGAGIFSEVFASFTDTFGGRSGKFENRLDELNEHALKGLKKKAQKKDANAIVSFRIDMDQISTKNGSMFMVNAIGTAVKLEELSEVKTNEKSNVLISKKYFEKEEAINNFVKSDFRITNITYKIEKIINMDIGDSVPFLEKILDIYLAPEVVNDSLRYFTTINLSEEEYVDSLISAINSMDNVFVNDIIFKKLKERMINNGENKVLTISELSNKLIGGMIDLDYRVISEFMQEIEPYNYYFILPVLKRYKDYSSIEDVKYIDKIIKLLSNDFEDIAEKEKGKLGSEKWKCPKCGKLNSNSKKCVGCLTDRKGLSDKIIKEINSTVIKLELIKKYIVEYQS